jgi:hypothetical protein
MLSDCNTGRFIFLLKMRSIKSRFDKGNFMAARHIYQVIPESGRWSVRKDSTILSKHDKKDLAEQEAQSLALKIISSLVLVYRLDGSIQKSVFHSVD